MSAKTVHETIVLSAAPAGRFLEGYVYGTPKPGTIMEVRSTEPKNGRHTWQAYNPGADGDRPIGPFAILLEDALQGKTVDDAFVSGTYCRLYCPIPGDEVLLLMKNIAGTSDAFAIADKIIIDDGTGKGIATTGTPETEPFVVMETVAAITADTLVHVMYTGH
jgi:hypothetical protein